MKYWFGIKGSVWNLCDHLIKWFRAIGFEEIHLNLSTKWFHVKPQVPTLFNTTSIRSCTDPQPRNHFRMNLAFGLVKTLFLLSILEIPYGSSLHSYIPKFRNHTFLPNYMTTTWSHIVVRLYRGIWLTESWSTHNNLS